MVQIPAGEGIRQISQHLYEQGIIGHPRFFDILTRLNKQDKNIKAGEYELSAAQAPQEILAILASGRVKLYKVTIPEGFTARQIAQALEETALASARVFLEISQAPVAIAGLGLDVPSSEGYLFPDTYHFARGTTPDAMLRAMWTQFRKNVTPQMLQQADSLGLNLHQVVTLASLIEREARVDGERPLISAVYHNRLKQNMRLQCDPTVIYALADKYTGQLGYDDLKCDSPYNTYLYPGLPPGPIASPGRASLQAALNPAPVDYIYFVSRNDGTHVFSNNLKDHNLAVRKYQKNSSRS